MIMYVDAQNEREARSVENDLTLHLTFSFNDFRSNEHFASLRER